MKNISSKTIAAISHITLLGWIIAMIMNSMNRTEFASYYLRQTLVLNAVLALGLTTFMGMVIAVFALVLLIISLLSALTGEKKEVPLVGSYFQNWFKRI